MLVPRKVQFAWSRCFEGSNCQPIAGGLSNSRVWRLSTLDSLDFALKAWPDHATNERRVRELHSFLATLSQRHNFIPRLILPATHSPASFVQDDGYYWEMTTWLEGEPLAADEAGVDHGKSAIEAVSQIHHTSRNSQAVVQLSPAIENRIEVLTQHLQNLPDLQRIVSTAPSPLSELAQRTLTYFRLVAVDLLEQLNRIRGPVESIWVVRDLHREHLLFQGGAVSGIIDFGAARIDEPLIDLVRLLGSLWPRDRELRHQLVKYYANQNGLPNPVVRFQLLDQVSTLLSAMQWLQWLLVENRSFGADREQLLARWGALNERLDQNQW